VGRKRVITSKRVIEADFVVLATGFKPNTFLAEKAGISLGEKGGIKVDDYMRTTCDEVFAAGDVAEIKSFLTKRPILNFFASSALLTGRIAGLNAAGFREKYVGCFHVWIVKLEDIVFGGVGLSVSEARKEGIEVFSVTAVVPDKPNYYTDLSKLRIKVVINADTKEIVGFQIMGRRRVLELLNLGSWLIYKKTTIRELEKIETAYTPSLCELVHPFSILARITRRKLKF
ncbi:MAG TPA: hypothetical protein ENF55_06445, partial [Thermoprotei archaeon]|nr:hypothetical protein [Thermoprotei archaeon]